MDVIEPMDLVAQWLEEARKHLELPEAMTLATVDRDGHPAARMVIARRVDYEGVVFYTNMESAKADDIRTTGHAACVFYWAPLQRQVRITGVVEAVDDADADAYFASRPPGSQLAAWASAQSQPVSGRDALERQYAAVTERFAGGLVPRPPYWGGYRVVPDEVELWSGQPNRLHDRTRYQLSNGSWHTETLQP